jgi:hypothetical protein
MVHDALLDWWPCETNVAPQVRSLFLLVLRKLWVKRNNRAFKCKSKMEALLLDSIIEEASRWKSVGFCE